MTGGSRIRVLGAFCVGALLVAGASAPPTAAARHGSGRASYSFVSMPDFLNADVGDVTASPDYQPGQPNSTNASYEAALGTVLDAVAAEPGGDVYLAGDLVEGHWGLDTAGTGTFGVIDSEAAAVEALQKAGAVYYPQGLARFADRGLALYPAVGDHELGDNPWQVGLGGYAAFKHTYFDLFKQTFADHLLKLPDGTPRFGSRPPGPASATAYAVRPNPSVQLITLDEFQRTDTSVRLILGGQQTRWLERVLQQAVADRVPWVIVQGHLPILGPVRYAHSSHMMYDRGSGRDSALWQLFAKYHVDLYLCGEVHAVTARRADRVTQVSHGGLFYWGETNYLTGTVHGGQLDLAIKGFAGTSESWTERLWQTDMGKSKPAEVSYPVAAPVVLGTMSLTSDNRVLSRSGLLDVYTPPAAPSAPKVTSANRP